MATKKTTPGGTAAAYTQEDAALAWRLLVELRTRITTQALPLREGVEAAALKSLHTFFQHVRETVALAPQAQACGAIVIEALNRDLRPFTARWHAREQAGRLGSVDERFQFRDELEDVQLRLRTLAGRLEDIAGAPVNAAPDVAQGEDEAPAGDDAPLPFGMGATPGMDEDTRHRLNEAERADVLARRSLYRRTNADSAVDAVGLALSGGGIRSATFGLGIVQVLARRGMLQDVDFLSTVSGGGYLGAFINTVVDDPDPAVGLAPGQRPFGGAAEGESATVRHLRNHSKYLAEGGLRTVFQLGFALLYGLLVTLLLVSPLLLLAASALVPLGLGDVFATLAGWAWAAVALAVIGYALVRTRAGMRRIEHHAAGLLALTVALSALAGVPHLSAMVDGHALQWLAGAALLPFALGLAGTLLGPARWPGRLALGALVLSGPLFFIAALLLCIAFAREAPWLSALVGVVLLWVGMRKVNLNFSALQRHYRDRLARTYLISGSDGAVRHHDERPLTAGALADGTVKGPVHLINAALNVPASDAAGLRGRDADFFVFGRHYCGSALTGWHPTRDWQAADPNLDLGTAMAISGAAATPHMGALTSPRYTVLLAMLNIRLAYWLRRPAATIAHLPAWRRWPAAGLYFLRELTGQLDEHSAHVNVSDGGHIENLGVYELLRRRCRTVIAIDGECDPAHHFHGLLTLVRMAWIDLGVRIAPDLADLRPNAQGLCNTHFIVAPIHYPEGGSGLLLYVKLSMTGNESEYLRGYRREHPAFPHESTAQQLFGESQWEAYRALGEHVGGELFAPVLVGDSAPQDAHAWVKRLASRLGS